jgi:hypothetical protein
MIKLSLEKDRLSAILLSFILFDILFLPFFQFILIPLSLPILFFYYIFIGFNIKNNLNFKLWIFFLSIVILSILHGAIYGHLSIFFIDNVKYFLSFCSLIFYIVFFDSKSVNLSISFTNKILKYFVFYISILSILLLFIPFQVLEFISQIYGRTSSDLDGFLSDLRFKYFFQDPNTLAYFMNLVLGFLLHTHKKSPLLLLLIFLILFNIIMTQSTGGLFSFIFIILFFIYKYLIQLNLRKKILLISLFFFLVIVVALFIFHFNEKNIFLKYFLDRIFETDDRIDSGGGRFAIWSELFNLYPSPIGIGYNLFIPELSKIRSPHSDFFGMFFRYGPFSLIPIIFYFVKIFKSSYYIILPALITFFINSLFDDQKLVLLFFLLTYILHKNYIKSQNIL